MKLTTFIFSLILFTASATQAESLILVHGYQGKSKSWFESGIVNTLEKYGWVYSGNLSINRSGNVETHFTRKNPKKVKRKVYTVSVPSEAPVRYQANYLKTVTDHLAKSENKIAIAAHSAGGISARMMMVLNPDLPISHLITIATPHLGTDSANIGSLAGKTPLAMMAPFMGANTFNRSQGLYNDLKREQPNTFLFWLNRRQHPDAIYVSIVHHSNSYSITDKMLAPVESQDMKRVYALKNRAKTINIRNGHSLSRQDGKILADILSNK